MMGKVRQIIGCLFEIAGMAIVMLFMLAGFVVASPLLLFAWLGGRPFDYFRFGKRDDEND